jgi:hypothetical protein
VDARAVVGLLAASCGLVPPGARVSAQELVPAFSLAALPKEPAVLRPEALLVAP